MAASTRLARSDNGFRPHCRVTNTVEVFFADRHTVQAALTFDADVTLSPSVPEASTWAMMLIGFAGLGFAAVRRARKTAPAAA